MSDIETPVLFLPGSTIEVSATNDGNRPLGDLSHLSVLLPHFHEGSFPLAEYIEYHTTILGESKLVAIASTNPLARADIFRLRAFLVHTGHVPGPGLERVGNKIAIATDTEPGFSYGDSVLSQDLGDLRTFYDGEIGATERDFYRGHYQIEQLQELAICEINKLITYSEAGNETEAVTVALSALGAIQLTLPILDQFSKAMNPDHFREFRRFFMADPLNGTPGASGVYTGSTPSLDSVLYGNRLPEQWRQEIVNNRKLYPVQQRAMLATAQEITNAGKSLVDIYVGASSDLKQVIVKIMEASRNFRAHHLGTIKAKLPEVIAGRPGTAGFPASAQLLLSRVNFMDAVIAELKS